MPVSNDCCDERSFYKLHDFHSMNHPFIPPRMKRMDEEMFRMFEQLDTSDITSIDNNMMLFWFKMKNMSMIWISENVSFCVVRLPCMYSAIKNLV